MDIRLPFAVVLLAYALTVYVALAIAGVVIKAWGDIRNTQQLTEKIKALVIEASADDAKKKPMGFN